MLKYINGKAELKTLMFFYTENIHGNIFSINGILSYTISGKRQIPLCFFPFKH